MKHTGLGGINGQGYNCSQNILAQRGNVAAIKLHEFGFYLEIWMHNLVSSWRTAWRKNSQWILISGCLSMNKI